MPSVEPQGLTDNLWLAAHDQMNSKPRIGEWPLGVGLATGLLGELIYGGCLELRDGELFRAEGSHCDDPALRPLLDKMAAEERRWAPAPVPAPQRPRAPAHQHGGWGQPYPGPGGEDSPTQAFGGGAWPPSPPGTPPWPGTSANHYQPAQPHDEIRHRRRGHDLRTWMSYLAYEGRAETRVVERLARAGLVERRERRRLLGASTVRYVVHDSAVAGMPASRLRIAVQKGRGLDRVQLLLAGLVLATGLHHHALATLSPLERSQLTDELKRGLDDMPRELLRAADAAIGDAAMR